MKMLDYGRTEVAVIEPHVARRTIDKLGLTGIREAHTLLMSLDQYTYVHKDHTDLIPDLASAVSKMNEDGTQARLLNQAFEPQTLTKRLECESP